jgi:hypothetical protein
MTFNKNSGKYSYLLVTEHSRSRRGGIVFLTLHIMGFLKMVVKWAK